MRSITLVILIIVAVSVIALTGGRRPAPLPIVQDLDSRPDLGRCAECHDEICESFAVAPHSFTLRPANQPEMVERFAGREIEAFDDTFRFEFRDGLLRFSSERFPGSLPVDWIFGSGHHALTPVSIIESPLGQSELIQLHVSWFADGRLGVTPGSEEQNGTLPSLGLAHTNHDTVRCFSCHTTYLPVSDGEIQFSEMHRGISCTRCHSGLERHLAADGDHPTREPWSTLSALESINRCGECHRRYDEFTEDELVPESTMLVRFAPVGISQSQCFKQSELENVGERRMDCVICHDPHSPAETDARYYVERCLECHDSGAEKASICSAQPMSSQCLECHMPKIEVLEHLSFTDHWIRVREEPERRNGQ